MKSAARHRQDPIVEFWRMIGGSGAVERWAAVPRTGHRSGRRFYSAALTLLGQSSLVAAMCGDKAELRSLKRPYYDSYFKFAASQPDLSVVRLFPRNPDSEADLQRHQLPDPKGIIGIALERVRLPVTGLGVVLFRHSQLCTALIHWIDGDGKFTWTLTSDPLLTLVLMDWWGSSLDAERPKRNDTPRVILDAERKKDLPPNSVAAFRRRFGIFTR
jgi:hypothetical protein